MRLRATIVGAALAVAACGEDGPSSGAGPSAPPLSCEAGSAALGDHCAAAGIEACPDGAGQGGSECGQLVSSCPAGTVAFFGKTECTPVGPGECPAGFTRDASGFGCVPVMATTACTGATRPRLGETSCAPVGDCDAPFPPAGATYFVDDSYTAGQIDATHFATIQAAVAAAPSGATIAIEEGSYTGTVTLPRAMTLVGRCPAKVTLRGEGAATPGLEVMQKVKAGFRGLTVTDFEVGLSAGGGAEVVAEALVVEANRRLGILGGDAGTRVSAKGVVVRGTLPDASGRFGYGAASGFEGEMTIEDSAILDSGETGAGAQRDGRITVLRSIVSGVSQRAGNNAYGWGVGTQTGGQAVITESAILDTFAGGVVASDETSVRVERSYVRGVRPGPTTGSEVIAAGVLAQGKSAKLEVEGSTIAGADKAGILVNAATATVTSSVVRDLAGGPLDGAGISVSDDGTLTLKSTAVMHLSVSGILTAGTFDASDLYITDVGGAGLAARKSAKITRLLVTDLRESKTETSGFGSGLYADDGAQVEVADVTIRKAQGIGMLVLGAGTKLTVQRAAVIDTAAPEDGSGYGLAGASGAEISLEDGVIVRARDVGVHMSDVGTVATLRGVAVVDTQPNGPEGRGRSLNAQDGATLNLSRVLVRGGTQVGLNVVGEGARAVVEDSVLASVAASGRGFGHGVAVTLGGALVMTHSVVRDHAGIGLVFADASGSVASSIVRANPIGVHTQEGVSLVEAPAAPPELTPLSVVFTSDTRFEENGSKVGSGEIPLPVQVASPSGQ